MIPVNRKRVVIAPRQRRLQSTKVNQAAARIIPGIRFDVRCVLVSFLILYVGITAMVLNLSPFRAVEDATRKAMSKFQSEHADSDEASEEGASKLSGQVESKSAENFGGDLSSETAELQHTADEILKQMGTSENSTLALERFAELKQKVLATQARYQEAKAALQDNKGGSWMTEKDRKGLAALRSSPVYDLSIDKIFASFDYDSMIKERAHQHQMDQKSNQQRERIMVPHLQEQHKWETSTKGRFHELAEVLAQRKGSKGGRAHSSQISKHTTNKLPHTFRGGSWSLK
ncbi:hypothetical protein CYMTET_54303 [Cymbomonas tetramitiformis]|uniref:Transmembrane protein n=1 Tax=Cymbomonas tetramitiformis TaxID=36881 RepID=A0AAE0BGH6_9CHLO|nr:hypothetical protein CYMTET_54303 [Cymbomonas tetramitiformis]